jgi:transposase-like protein
VQVNITKLIDDVQCYQTVRELRWPDGVQCPSCESQQVIKRGFDDTEPARQRYECHDCHTRFDDLTDTSNSRFILKILYDLCRQALAERIACPRSRV